MREDDEIKLKNIMSHLKTTIESDELDFKEKYEGIKKYGKLLVAFANNKGGFIVFGVDDETKIYNPDFEGKETLKKEFKKDTITDFVTNYIDGYIKISIIGENCLKISHNTEQKPHMFLKEYAPDNKTIWRKKEIYYRYNSKIDLIGKTELNSIYNARMQNFNLNNPLHSYNNIEISTEDLDKIIKHHALIKEGEFNEVEGQPALKIVGKIVEKEKHYVQESIAKDPRETHKLTLKTLAKALESKLKLNFKIYNYLKSLLNFHQLLDNNDYLVVHSKGTKRPVYYIHENTVHFLEDKLKSIENIKSELVKIRSDYTQEVKAAKAAEDTQKKEKEI